MDFNVYQLLEVCDDDIIIIFQVGEGQTLYEICEFYYNKNCKLSDNFLNLPVKAISTCLDDNENSVLIVGV